MNEQQNQSMEVLLNELQHDVTRIENTAWLAARALENDGSPVEERALIAERVGSVVEGMAMMAETISHRLESEVFALEQHRRAQQ